jgi:hypothetical protein
MGRKKAEHALLYPAEHCRRRREGRGDVSETRHKPITDAELDLYEHAAKLHPPFSPAFRLLHVADDLREARRLLRAVYPLTENRLCWTPEEFDNRAALVRYLAACEGSTL